MPSERHSFDTQTLHEKLRPHVVGTDSFEYKDVSYEYGIIHPDAASSIPNFVGMPEGKNLFASQSIPSELLPYFLTHEIECNRLQAGQVGRCADIESNLIDHVPDEIVLAFLSARRSMFDALVREYAIDLNNPQNDFCTEIAGTTKLIRKLTDRLVTSVRYASIEDLG